jgi:hypothetical protein
MYLLIAGGYFASPGWNYLKPSEGQKLNFTYHMRDEQA